MKKLTQLESLLSKKELMSTNDTQNTKGGQRFMTKKYRKMIRKLAKLQLKGFNPVVSEHNGEYCIDW